MVQAIGQSAVQSLKAHAMQVMAGLLIHIYPFGGGGGGGVTGELGTWFFFSVIVRSFTLQTFYLSNENQPSP